MSNIGYLSWLNDSDPRYKGWLQRARDATRQTASCYWPSCTDSAIGSHLVQRRGPLETIADEGHVIELSLNLFKGQFFESRGLTKSLTFPGFCQKHDNDLFEPIESGDVDLASFEAQVLVVYRSLIGEIWKKEWNLRWYQRIFDEIESFTADPNLRAETIERYSRQKERESIALAASRMLRRKLEASIGGTARSIEPYSLTVSSWVAQNLPIATSACYGDARESSRAITEDQYRAMIAAAIAGEPIDLPGDLYFLVMYPIGADSTLVASGFCGYGDAQPSAQMIPSTDANLGDFLNDILIKRVETWAMNPTWFKKHVATRQEAIIQEIDRLLYPSMKGHAVKVPLILDKVQTVANARRPTR